MSKEVSIAKVLSKPIAAVTIKELTSLFMNGTTDERLSTIMRLALHGLQEASSSGKNTTAHLKLLLELSKAIDAKKPVEGSTPGPNAKPSSTEDLTGWAPPEQTDA